MTLTPEQEQRIRELFELIAEEKDPEKVQVLAGKLGPLVAAQSPLRKPNDRQLRVIELVAQGLRTAKSPRSSESAARL